MPEHEILSHDLRILEEMVHELDAYLMGESMWWSMSHSDLPRLTIGGCLMRANRLPIVRDMLDEAEQARLQTALDQLEQLLGSKVTRLEHRAHQELRARLSEWAGHLRALKSNVMAEIEHYANIVDTRVVIGVLVDKLGQAPHQLDRNILGELEQLDRNLRNRWQEGAFIWPEVWEPAYPRTPYWYLYGRRKQH